MDAGSLLARYALPGGYAALVGAYYQVVFTWAWGKPADELVSMSPGNAITTIGGAIVIGFVITILQAAADRLLPELGADLGIAALEGLADVACAQSALAHAYGLSHELGPCPRPRWHSRQQRERSRQVRAERLPALRSLLNLAADGGEPHIQRSYVRQTSICQVYAASRIVIAAISIAAAVDILARHRHDFTASLGRSLLVSLASIALAVIFWRLLTAMRRQTAAEMTRQLCNSLRAWALRHPHVLAQLAFSQRPPKPLTASTTGQAPAWRSPAPPLPSAGRDRPPTRAA